MKGGFTVTGWKSKKMLRDVDLVDDIITLRRQLEEAERQRDNALAVATRLQREKDRLIAEIKRIADHDQLGHLR